MRRLRASIFLALAAAAAGCGHDEARHPRQTGPAVEVAVVTAAEEPWPGGPTFSGTVEPLRRAELATVLMGRVDAVLHDAGDTVARDALLARGESREVAARLAQAESAVAAARAAERNAAATRDRIERLHARQAATQQHLDDARAGHEAAQAGLGAAEEGVAAARMYVSYAEVRAPFAGVVVERHVEAGDTAAPGMPLFTLEDLSRVKIEAQVPETVAGGLAPGDPVEVEVPSAGGARAGEIAEVLPAADPDSRTFTVRVLLGNADRALRSGTFARLRISGAATPVLAVPESAVLERGALRGVFVVGTEGLARVRWVTLGERRDGRVAVLTGLSPGERVVAEPPLALQDGSPVEAR